MCKINIQSINIQSVVCIMSVIAHDISACPHYSYYTTYTGMQLPMFSLFAPGLMVAYRAFSQNVDKLYPEHFSCPQRIFGVFYTATAYYN